MFCAAHGNPSRVKAHILPTVTNSKCKDFMVNLCEDIGAGTDGGNKWPPISQSAYNWAYAIKPNGGRLVMWHGCKIGKYGLDLDVHLIPVDSTGYMKAPRSVSSVLELSIAVVLCGDSQEDVVMLRKVASKLLTRSGDIYVVYFHFGKDHGVVHGVGKELKAELKDKAVNVEERLIGYGVGIGSELVTSRWTRNAKKRISIEPLYGSESVNNIGSALSHTIAEYIQRLEVSYKAV